MCQPRSLVSIASTCEATSAEQTQLNKPPRTHYPERISLDISMATSYLHYTCTYATATAHGGPSSLVFHYHIAFPWIHRHPVYIICWTDILFIDRQNWEHYLHFAFARIYLPSCGLCLAALRQVISYEPGLPVAIAFFTFIYCPQTFIVLWLLSFDLYHCPSTFYCLIDLLLCP